MLRSDQISAPPQRSNPLDRNPLIETPLIDPPLIETPCLKICVLEPGSKLCRGCGRTLDEIAGWGAMAGSERRRIMALLPDRIASMTAPASTCAAPERKD
jgi:predicted Fe-S protein YdhL (DUF1289 family)